MWCFRFVSMLVIAFCCAGEVRAAESSACNAPGVRIPDPADFLPVGPLFDGVTIEDSLTIDNVKLGVDVKHGNINELFMGIFSPAGTFVQLFSGTDSDDAGSLVLVTFSDGGVSYDDADWGCDCEVMPSGPGTMADFNGENSRGDWVFVIEDVVPFTDGTLNEWCVYITGCGLIPPSDLSCEVGEDDVALSWSNEGAPTTQYILRNGKEIAAVTGDTTEYVDEGLGFGFWSYQIIGVDESEGCKSAGIPCGVAIGAVGQCVELTSGNTIDYFADPVFSKMDFTEDIEVVTVLAQVGITHTWIGDLVIELTGPDETTVRLFDTSTSDEDGMHLTFADDGADMALVSSNCECFVKPSGPGALADFAGISSMGSWTLMVMDTFDEDSGKLNDWCLFVIGEEDDPPPAIQFLRGDVNGDNVYSSLGDPIAMLGYFFLGNDPPGCLEVVDADGNGALSGLTDTLFLLRYGFSGGATPPAPFPTCGEAAALLIGCESPPACP